MAKTRRHSLHQKVLEKVFEVNLMEICVKPLFEKPSRGFCWRWILTRTYFMHSTWMQQLESFVSACEFVWQTCATLSVYGRRLMFERSQVRILALYTGWTWHFSHWFVILYCLLKKTKNMLKQAGVGPFLKKERNRRFRNMVIFWIKQHVFSSSNVWSENLVFVSKLTRFSSRARCFARTGD